MKTRSYESTLFGYDKIMNVKEEDGGRVRGDVRPRSR